MIYKTLSESGFDVYYEPTKYTIWSGFKPIVPFYNKDNKTKLLKLDNKKIIDITYTPDFTIKMDNMLIIIEAKGFENDCFPMKKKMFRGYLEQLQLDTKKQVLFFEIYTKKQLLQAIQIISDYGKPLENNTTKDSSACE